MTREDINKLYPRYVSEADRVLYKDWDKLPAAEECGGCGQDPCNCKDIVITAKKVS